MVARVSSPPRRVKTAPTAGFRFGKTVGGLSTEKQSSGRRVCQATVGKEATDCVFIKQKTIIHKGRSVQNVSSLKRRAEICSVPAVKSLELFQRH